MRKQSFFGQIKKKIENFFISSFFKTFINGCSMAITDLVPGVSGSTIALVFGFYQKLLTCIKNIEFKAFLNLDFKKFIKSFDYIFFIPFLAGVIFSFLIFSKIFNFFLSHEISRAFFLSFFLGAVLSCIFFLLKELFQDKIASKNIFLILLGTIFSFSIAFFNFSDFNLSLHFEIKLIISGFLAIFAMLLPGISGSLVFMILGVYPIIINALSNISSFENIKILSYLAIGIFSGLLIFPKMILFFLKKYYFFVLSFLIGLMIGSLYSLWPFWIYKKNVVANKIFLVPSQIRFVKILSFEFIISFTFLILGFFLFFKIKQKLLKKT